MSAMPEGKDQPKKSGLWKGIAIGCAAIVLLVIGGCVAGSCYVKKNAATWADELQKEMEKAGKEFAEEMEKAAKAAEAMEKAARAEAERLREEAERIAREDAAKESGGE